MRLHPCDKGPRIQGRPGPDGASAQPRGGLRSTDCCNPSSSTPRLCDPGLTLHLCVPHRSIKQDQYQDLLCCEGSKFFHPKHLEALAHST